MSLSAFPQGSVIFTEGDTLDHLSLITNGNVETQINGRVSRFTKGDTIGLCDLGKGNHSHTYTATTDVTVFSHPCENYNDLEKILRDNADVANLMVNSMLRHISETLQYRDALKKEAKNAYKFLHEIYRYYSELSETYGFTSKKLHGMSNVEKFSGDDFVENWEHDHYMELKNFTPETRRKFFYGNPGISMKFFSSSAEDIHKAYQACKAYREYMEKISVFFLNTDGHDLFALVSELRLNTVNVKEANELVHKQMSHLKKLLSGMTGVDHVYYTERWKAYKGALAAKREQQEETVAVPDTPGVKQNLSDSLDIILNYAECSVELSDKFAKSVRDYTNLPERGSPDPEARALRMSLTVMFYEIYEKVFIKSLKDPAITTIIKMFLNFGYVDATLAGLENADYLYSIADSIKGDPSNGVYTLCEWLTAILSGKKEPSRSESDQDYEEHVREMEKEGKIDAKEKNRLLSDRAEKLRFELKNVFPIINKITFGRISTYCPLFADHNIQRRLETSLVTPAALKKLIDDILYIDPGAYCREVSYANDKLDITNEYLHIEVLPDIILMPNVGIRGSLWQEIEGKNRRTPARMFLSIFLDDDLKNMVIRLTGEFRWEMCKRVQGIRWNDIANPSLTGDYVNYLQFYKGNRELTPEIREDIRDELASARNNYKLVFVSNYASWLLYEATGASRLNKYVRGILLTYCPFSPAVREKLIMNPRYGDMLNRYNMKHKQRIQRMTNLIQRVGRLTRNIPKELLEELEYLKNS